MGGLIAFGVVVVIGVLVWFLVLKPDSAPARGEERPVQPTTDPTTEPTTEPTDGQTIEPTTEPTTPPEEARLSIQVCKSVDEGANCIDPIDITDTGWPIPRDLAAFNVYLFCENLAPGDRIVFSYVDQATGQQVGEARFDPAPQEVADSEAWVYWSEWRLPEGQNKWEAGRSIEVVIYYNDQALTFQVPTVLNFQE